MGERLSLLGVPIDRVTMDEAASWILGVLRESGPCAPGISGAGSGPGVNEGGGFGSKPLHVVTVNPEMVIAARGNRELREIIAGADLAVPDGIGVVWAARIQGIPVRERVAGFDLMFRLLELAHGGGDGSGISIYLLGGRPGVASGAAQEIRNRFPWVSVSGTHHGYFDEREGEQIRCAINATRPDICFVGLGVPLQERWIADHRDNLRTGVLMGVGGSFDIIAGRKRRAPVWIQRLGLEWFYRLLREPGRIWRIMSLPRFALLVIADTIFGKSKG